MMRRATATVAGASLVLLASGTAVQGQDLTDAEVAHVAVTANAIDVDLAKVALERAASPDVKEFARTMIEDHTGVNTQVAALAQRLGVTPAANGVSTSLQQGADEAKARLSGLTGAAFDRAYIEREVGYHQAVLEAIDRVLLPTTENAEVKNLLGTVRPAVAAHLERARAIRQALDS